MRDSGLELLASLGPDCDRSVRRRRPDSAGDSDERRGGEARGRLGLRTEWTEDGRQGVAKAREASDDVTSGDGSSGR